MIFLAMQQFPRLLHLAFSQQNRIFCSAAHAQQQPQMPQQSGEMPNSGSYEDWYNYFFPFFGGSMP